MVSLYLFNAQRSLAPSIYVRVKNNAGIRRVFAMNRLRRNNLDISQNAKGRAVPQFIGYIVEGKIRSDFGSAWLHVGIYPEYQQAQAAASDPRLDDRGVTVRQIGRYCVERRHEIPAEPRCDVVGPSPAVAHC